jgi:hypothetical protein
MEVWNNIDIAVCLFRKVWGCCHRTAWDASHKSKTRARCLALTRVESTRLYGPWLPTYSVHRLVRIQSGDALFAVAALAEGQCPTRLDQPSKQAHDRSLLPYQAACSSDKCSFSAGRLLTESWLYTYKLILGFGTSVCLFDPIEDARVHSSY